VLTRRRWQAGTPSDIFYHTNALGSVSAVTSSAGAVVERYKYDAYGQVTFLSPTFTPLTSSAVMNNILFTGRYFDTEANLYYYRARTYHPYLGRFIQRDPLGEAASINLYNYVFNNPVNDTDPTGMLSGQMAEWYNASGVAASEQAWHGREAQDQESMRKAEEEMSKLHGYTAMEDQHKAGIALRELSHWAGYYANRQGSRNQEIAQQIQASLTDPDNMRNMASPKGVSVFITGIRQRAAGEGAIGTNCSDDRTELDLKAATRRDEGYVTLTVDADALAQVGKFNEPSETGVQILANAVLGVSAAGSMGGQGGSLPIEITGFSRGGGGAVALTNRLTDALGVSGSNISLNLIDPYMGPASNTVNDPGVHVSLSKSTGFHWQTVGLAIGAIFGADFTRDLYQRNSVNGEPMPVSFTSYNLPHSQMDNLWPFGAVMP